MIAVALVAAVVAMLTPAAAPGPSAVESGATVGLYGGVSGFAKARTDRISITVGPLPGLSAAESYAALDPVLDAWNTAAGWWLFAHDPTGEISDVTFVDLAGEPSCVALQALACTGWDQFPTGWYRGCTIAVPFDRATPANTIEHELGHCLGFVDVATTDTGYRGIMSYARDRSSLVLGEQDLASLAAVGYRGEL